jgi:F0F1-type ATP synthase membrane subunit b/b'
LNWFFWLLLIVAAVALWFLCSFAYRPIGKFFRRIFKEAKDEIEKYDEYVVETKETKEEKEI